MRGVNYSRPRILIVKGASKEARAILSRIGVLQRRIQLCDALFPWPAYVETFQRDIDQLQARLRELGYEPNVDCGASPPACLLDAYALLE